MLETLVIVGVVALVLSRLRRRLRVNPDQPNRAPLAWLVALTKDARLHRRFRRLAARARAASRGGPRHRRRMARSSSQRLCIDLEHTVIDLDEQLIEATTLDFDAKSREIKRICADAERVDGALERLEKLITHEGSASSSAGAIDPINDLLERLDQLEVKSTTNTQGLIDATASPQSAFEVTANALDSQS